MTRAEILAVAKPILFNTPMVQAIQRGDKTATRRIIKYSCPTKPEDTLDDFIGDSDPQLLTDCAPYKTGNILYVRETWAAQPVTPGGHARGHDVYYYKADGDLRPEALRGNWRPSIHMPKEAARLFLQVKGVRVERLQDITVEQCEKEGMTEKQKFVLDKEEYWYWFRELWDSTIKPADLPHYGWDANPWVWVIEFKGIEPE